jgi:hypothetical protein
MKEREMYCVTCDTDVLFEVPPCLDEHDDDCPELVCTGCGAAVLMAPVVVWFSRPRGASVAPQQRRAA